MGKVKCLCVAILLSFSLRAQELILTSQPVYLDISGEIPKDLLATKTAVIIDVRGYGMDWKEVSKSAHNQLRRTGIDAIGYFKWNYLFSGFEPQKNIAEFLNTRQVSNVILINASPTNAEVWLTRFNKSWTFLNNGEKTWYSSDSTVSKALLPLYQRAAISQERKNLLISDTPEYYEELVFHKTTINNTFPPDVKVFKTAVALMPPVLQPTDISDGLLRAFTTYQDAIMSRNEKIKDIAANNFPFKFEFFDFGMEIEDLRAKTGCNFLLGYAYGEAREVSKIFRYAAGDSKDVTINAVLSEKPIIRTIPGERTVFKFYLKNIVTGEIYIGSVWDADVSLEDAMQNFIFYMKRDLKVNP